MRFVTDLFQGTTGANLTARAGELGAAWAKQNGGSADIVLSPANRAMGSANALARCVASGIPQSADYDAVVRLRKLSAHGEGGVMVRASASADTGYALSHVHSSGQWLLRRFIAGTAAALGTQAQAWTLDTDKLVRFRVRSVDAATVRLVAVVDGQIVLAADDTATERITAAGRVGLRLHPGTATLFAARGYHVGLITAVALPDDPRPRAPKPADGPRAQRLALLADRDRDADRVAVVREAGLPASWQVTKGGQTYTVSVVAGPRSVTVKGQPQVEVVVGCDPLPPGFDPVRRFFLPPYRVPDGTIREEDTGGGDPEWRDNFREDAREALRVAVSQQVAAVGLP